jgi:hypothetical protein
MTDFMKLFEEFGTMRSEDPASEKAQTQVKRVQDFITENMYTCSNEILYYLSQWYVGGGEVTQNIDEMGGKGTAEFVSKAIAVYCGK